MKTIIDIPQEVIDRKAALNEKVYLGDFMEFPTNCIFSKSSTGCGGTTLALRDNKATIACLPFRNAVESKEADNAVFAIYGGHNIGEDGRAALDKYMKECHTGDEPKIITTYDSLPRVMVLLRSLGYNDFSNWRLLVDELHLLFNMYKLRKPAVLGVFETAKVFKDVVYMTATPIEERYLFRQIRGMDVVEVNYPDSGSKVYPRQVRYLKPEIAKLCREFNEGKRFGNAHIFVNSVRFISEVIEAAGLTPDNTRAVVSTLREGNKITLKGFPISKINSEVKKINFYSSTAFESADIYDEDGQMFIVTDGCNRNTTIDLSTTFIQVLGRIRNSSSRTAIHYFSTSKWGGVSPEEFQSETERQVKLTQTYIKMYNNATGNEKEALMENAKRALNESYYYIDGENIVFDENLLNLEIVNFKCFKGDYSSKQNILAKLLKKGVEIVEDDYHETLSEEIKKDPKKRSTFKERFEEYARIVETPEDEIIGKNEQMAELEDYDHYLKDAYFTLGKDKVAEMNFVKQKVRDEIIVAGYRNQFTKIIKMFNFSPEQRISYETKEKRCAEIAAKLGLEKPIKLSQYYDIKQIQKRTKNGRRINELLIIRQKVISNAA